MDNFTIDELLGRKCFEELYGSNLYFPAYRFEFFDASGITIDGRSFISELKLRHNHINDYPTIMAEAAKIIPLQSYSNQTGISSFYLSFFTRHTIVYNTNVIDLSPDKIVKKLLPATTSEDNGEKYKDVVYLSKEQGKIINKGYMDLLGLNKIL